MKNLKIIEIKYLYTVNGRDYCELTQRDGKFWNRRHKKIVASSLVNAGGFWRNGSSGRRLPLSIETTAKIYDTVSVAKATQDGNAYLK